MYRAILSLIIAGLLSLAGPAHSAMVHGTALLDGETDHSGIQVSADRCYLPGTVYTVYTNSAGEYQFDWLPSALWTFTFVKNGFWADSVVCYYVQALIPTEVPTVELTPVAGEGFPGIEGRHDPFASNPNEWAYVNVDLIGEESGEEYSAMVAFFKPGLRIFAIADLDQQQIYTRSRVGRLIWATSCLDLSFYHLPAVERESGFVTPGGDLDREDGDSPGDVEHGGTSESGSRRILWHEVVEFAEAQPDEAVRRETPYWLDRWYNKSLNGSLIPFQYHIEVRDVAVEDGNPIRLDLDMASQKSPLMVGGDGNIVIGNGRSGYYSHTRVQVEGTIEVHGRTEPVTGWAWIDHQWGDFLGVGHGNVQWEWFSIQLENWTDILVADVWVDGVPQGSFGEGLNLYDPDGNLEILPGYDIQPLSFWDDPVSGRRFATSWRITEPLQQIDLTVEAAFDAQAISITPTQIFPVSFWEGPCTVSGSVGGVAVSGKAYTELTHSWEPQSGSLDDGAGRVDEPATVDEPSAGEALSYELAQNWPNPFNPTTTIRFTLPASERVTLKVYNLQGRDVATLCYNESLLAGVHQVYFDGAGLPSGVYFYKLVTPNFTASQKMLLVK